MTKMTPVPLMVFVVAVAAFFAVQAHGQIYMWVDENGVRHISDTPPLDNNPDREIREMPSIRSGGAPSTSPRTDDSKRRSKAKANRTPSAPGKAGRVSLPKVELYTTSWCKYCKMARQFFRSRGVAFKEYDIERDRRAALRKDKLDSKKGVPFAIVNGTRIHGYAPESYKEALAP